MIDIFIRNKTLELAIEVIFQKLSNNFTVTRNNPFLLRVVYGSEHFRRDEMMMAIYVIELGNYKIVDNVLLFDNYPIVNLLHAERDLLSSFEKAMWTSPSASRYGWGENYDAWLSPLNDEIVEGQNTDDDMFFLGEQLGMSFNEILRTKGMVFRKIINIMPIPVGTANECMYEVEGMAWTGSPMLKGVIE